MSDDMIESGKPVWFFLVLALGLHSVETADPIVCINCIPIQRAIFQVNTTREPMKVLASM